MHEALATEPNLLGRAVRRAEATPCLPAYAATTPRRPSAGVRESEVLEAQGRAPTRDGCATTPKSRTPQAQGQSQRSRLTFTSKGRRLGKRDGRLIFGFSSLGSRTKNFDQEDG